MTVAADQAVGQGQVITFYSYKGGTGRSMALANTAWILASNGCRVLVVDWDLESPGLHRYLQPFLVDKALQSSRGTIDLIWDFASAAMSHDEAANGPNEDASWVENRAKIERYAVSLDWEFPGGGTLDYVPPGRQDAGYSRRVSGIDWERLYNIWRDNWPATADYEKKTDRKFPVALLTFR
jgi:hypothetical protein